MKVAVGLSGGVDSALSAALLVEQGHEVTGVFLECWNEPGCRTDQDRQDALAVALKLKIPFRVLDFKRQYRERVLESFYREYQAGRTPNPDIWCNREIKFGLFLEWSLKNGFDYLATGHYAQVMIDSSKINFRAHTCREWARGCARKFTLTSSIKLLQSVDKAKDQTYFLAMLKEKQLRRVLFPIGHLTKKQVRIEAKKRGLPVWNKKDSSGICFVGHDLNFREFLRRRIKEHEGEAVDKTGKIVGTHQGVEFYTIGQRYARPLFVIQKDILRNRLIVGTKADLARSEFEVERWSRIRGIKPVKEFRGFEGIHPQVMGKSQHTLKVRIRHQGRLISCKIEGKKVKLAKPEFGIAPGQLAVIYAPTRFNLEGLECLGGGVIR